jgi:hypothetical protein
MNIHKGRPASPGDEKGFQVFKQNGFVRPSEVFFDFFEIRPLGRSLRVVPENPVFSLIT